MNILVVEGRIVLAATPELSRDPWLAEAVTAVDGRTPSSGAPVVMDAVVEWAAARWPSMQLAECRFASGERVGVVGWRPLADPSSAIRIDLLAIRHDQRNLGYGAEAVEQVAAMHPDRTLFAATPRSNGLALYFWLRVGFRPVRLDEVPWMAHDPTHLWTVSDARCT